MDKIIFVLLALFPFGQLIKFDKFLLFDFVIIAAAIYALVKNLPRPKFFTHINAFLLVAAYSYILFLAIYPNVDWAIGIMYLIRLFAYSYFLIFAYNLKNKEKYLDYLLSLSLVSSFFGWIQYFTWPDLTALKYLGWDDHLLRMVGTFLDPTYLALIILFGIIIAIYKKKNAFLFFLLVSLAFTYSRVAIFIALLLIILKRKYIALFVLIMTMLILPKNIGEGTNLARTASGNNKLINYSQTIEIIKKYPLFGVGYNNLCFARQKYIGDQQDHKHSCSGSDSSILFILATTGILGLTSFINLCVRVFYNLNSKFYILYSSIAAAIVMHSLFANSLFYPFIMFYLLMITAVALRREVHN